LQALVAAAAQLKGLSSTEVQDFLVTLESEVGGVADLFNLSPPQPGSFHTLIREAQMTLSDLAETAVVEGDAQLAAVLRETNDLQSELRQMVSGRRSKSLRRGDAARPAAPAPQMQIAQGPATLLGRVEMVIQRCRDERAPVSLVLVAVDRFSEVLAEVGPETADAVLRWLAEQCAELAEMPGNVLGAGEAQYAILLPQFDRTSAASASRQLLDQARRKFRQLQGECPRPIKVSLGVATVRLPARNFLARDLIEAARRCLQAAQSSGSDTVKSIEL
jgi:diguanylate cyclase (GGDEF)-like protein